MITQEEKIFPNHEHGVTRFYANQGESNARKLVFLLYDANGAEVSITTGKALLYIFKPDSTVVVAACTINTDGNPNAVSCVLPYEACTYSGLCSMLLQLLPDSRELIYDRLELQVKSGILDQIVSHSDLGPLGQIIGEYERLPELAELMEAAREASRQALEGAKRAGEAAETAKKAARPPYIGENGNWYTWDEETQGCTDSGRPSRGVQGEKGDPGRKGDQGDKGDRGERGINGVSLAADGHFAFHVNEAGHLILSYTGDEAPDFSINEGGHLIYNF